MFSWKNPLESQMIDKARAYGMGMPRRCDFLLACFALDHQFVVIMKL